MKKLLIVLAMLSLLVMGGLAQASQWDDYVIRNSSSTPSTAPVIQDNNVYTAGAKEFITSLGGQKAGWGNNDLNGFKVGQIGEISIDRLDDLTRFTAGSGPSVAPYFNIWITNSTGDKFAVIANEPSNPEWTGTSRWDMNWDVLKTKIVKVYETADKSWLPSNGVGLTFADLSDFKIQAPTASALATGWAGLGTGAPRELGTNVAYAFNWMFGDTQGNYVSGAVDTEGFVVANPVASPVAAPVPLPAAVWLLGSGLMGLVGLRRRFSK